MATEDDIRVNIIIGNRRHEVREGNLGEPLIKRDGDHLCLEEVDWESYFIPMKTLLMKAVQSQSKNLYLRLVELCSITAPAMFLTVTALLYCHAVESLVVNF